MKLPKDIERFISFCRVVWCGVFHRNSAAQQCADGGWVCKKCGARWLP